MQVVRWQTLEAKSRKVNVGGIPYWCTIDWATDSDTDYASGHVSQMFKLYRLFESLAERHRSSRSEGP